MSDLAARSAASEEPPQASKKRISSSKIDFSGAALQSGAFFERPDALLTLRPHQHRSQGVHLTSQKLNEIATYYQRSALLRGIDSLPRRFASRATRDSRVSFSLEDVTHACMHARTHARTRVTDRITATVKLVSRSSAMQALGICSEIFEDRRTKTDATLRSNR